MIEIPVHTDPYHQVVHRLPKGQAHLDGYNIVMDRLLEDLVVLGELIGHEIDRSLRVLENIFHLGRRYCLFFRRMMMISDRVIIHQHCSTENIYGDFCA